MTITAAVDGSSLGNPGPAGWAWYISEDVWAAGGWPQGTNNQGELMAILQILRATAAAGKADEPLHLLADSQYAIKCVTEWTPGWKRRGWRKADGKPVLNRDIIEAIDKAMQGRVVTFEWVRGHAGHPMNEAVDQRARAVSEAYQSGQQIPTGPGFPGVAVSDLAVPTQPASVQPASAQPTPTQEEMTLF